MDSATGIGTAGVWLGLGPDSGVRLGGVWVGDSSYLISGGADPKSFSSNSLFILDFRLDAGKLIGWKGGAFGVAFLRFDGEATNGRAGATQCYDSLPGLPPLHRSELYQLWLRQELLDGKLILRVGKMAATIDFGNVVRPVATQDRSLFIPSVSGLAFTPVFVNPTLLGAIPGYYNSAFGAIGTFLPAKNVYASYGIYDGNNANGIQTGTHGPRFNGYVFHIGEAGAAWLLSGRPGSAGAGVWHQTGELHGPAGTQSGATGVYLFASQRLWLRHPGRDNSGVSGFIQFGANDAKTLPFRQYVGLGLTSFGLTPGRPRDSAGVGIAWSWLNRDIFPQRKELMLQTYYQAHVVGPVYLQPVLSYIPNPGADASLRAAWAATLQLTVLF